LDFQLIGAVLSIVIIDLTLSGDNALIIGMAAHRLAPAQRRLAILLGTGGAVGLRVVFAALASLLLSVPLLQATGGVILLWIALKLLRDEQDETKSAAPTGTSLREAVRIIILADVVMSLDNVLAIGGASHGSIKLLIFGLALSMPIVMFGSSLLASLMGRLRWVLYLGAGVLVWTATQMILEDDVVGRFAPSHWAVEYVLALALGAAVLAGGRCWRGSRLSSTGAG